MNKKFLIFDEQCINKSALHANKRPVTIDKIDARKLVLSRKDLHGEKGLFKSFIRYLSEINAFPMPLCIKIPQMNGYANCFDSNTNRTF